MLARPAAAPGGLIPPDIPEGEAGANNGSEATGFCEFTGRLCAVGLQIVLPVL